MAISIAMTMNVYGRRSARRTIHMTDLGSGHGKSRAVTTPRRWARLAPTCRLSCRPAGIRDGAFGGGVRGQAGAVAGAPVAHTGCMLTSLDVEPALDRPGAWPWIHDAAPVSRAEVVPEIVLPEQFASLQRNGEARPPEQRLMLAVLEDAVHTHLRGRDPRTSRDLRFFHEAADWFASDATDSPFAFVTICQVWSLDPDYIRSGLARWHARRERTLPLPFRIRRVSGSRHHVNLSSAERRRARARRRQ
jgi:hypothetical protein